MEIDFFKMTNHNIYIKISKLIYKIVIGTSVLFFLTICTFFQKQKLDNIQEPQFYCGTCMDEMNNPRINKINNPSLIKNVFGETLFKNNCAQCHNADASTVVGPGLAGIKERRDKEWLIKWIQNPQKVIQSGDKYAIKLFEKFNKTEMTAFTNFKEEEILAILEYIDEYNQSQRAIP